MKNLLRRPTGQLLLNILLLHYRFILCSKLETQYCILQIKNNQLMFVERTNEISEFINDKKIKDDILFF